MSKETEKSGVGFLGLLALIFITLKLIRVIQWSWLWVLAPLWGPFVIVLLILAVVGLIAVIAALVD